MKLREVVEEDGLPSSSIYRLWQWRWRPPGANTQILAYSGDLLGVSDKGFDAHRALAFGAAQWVDLKHAFEECGPRHRCLWAAIARCAVLVLTSRTEGMGRVLLEAMAFGKPTVGSDVDGIPNYIEHAVTGLVVPRPDVDALARALRELMANPALRHKLGEAGRERVFSAYSEDIYMSRVSGAIKSVLRNA